MKVIETEIEGLLILEPRVFKDERGSFTETFNNLTFTNAVGKEVVFVQDNQSISKKGVLRGLHFQNPPYAQGKLVRVVKGSVLDVAVDIRASSSSYGKYVAVELSDVNGRQFWIPPGFAHGFVALEENTIFAYKCTELYHPESEGCIRWNDRSLNINWIMQSVKVSEKDSEGIEFTNFSTEFR